MKKYLSFVVAVVLTCVLSACGDNSKPPVVRTQPNAEGGISTFQVEMRTTYKDQDGFVMESPRGMTASYLFREGSTAMRLDIPGGMFPDNQSRIVVLDGASGGEARFLLQDSLLPDPALSSADASGLTGIAMGMMDTVVGFNDKPFMKISPDQFVENLRFAAFDVTNQTDARVVATRTRATPLGQQTMTLHFDAEVGAVTSVDNVIVTPELTQTTNTDIKYTAVVGIEDSAIPYEITAKATMELNTDIEPLELPVPDKVVEVPEGQSIVVEVPAGMEIVDEYIAPVGEGTVDMTKVEMEQTIRYEDIKVNEVTADYVLVGGAK